MSTTNKPTKGRSLKRGRPAADDDEQTQPTEKRAKGFWDLLRRGSGTGGATAVNAVVTPRRVWTADLLRRLAAIYQGKPDPVSKPVYSLERDLHHMFLKSNGKRRSQMHSLGVHRVFQVLFWMVEFEPIELTAILVNPKKEISANVHAKLIGLDIHDVRHACEYGAKNGACFAYCCTKSLSSSSPGQAKIDNETDKHFQYFTHYVCSDPVKQAEMRGRALAAFGKGGILEPFWDEHHEHTPDTQVKDVVSFFLSNIGL